MSESTNVLCLKTEPKIFGVQVEWKWPDGCHWFSRLELQYVREKSIPVVKVIEWPVTGSFISGLKAGEKIHVRMRGLDKEGNGPEWKACDWIEGVASADAGEYLGKIGALLSGNHAENVELSGAATDVLYALFFHGALVDGDLPSKAGADELRELGFVKTQDKVTSLASDSHYSFLTPAGQKFAISYLVDSNFGKQPQFKTENGQVFINEPFISDIDLAATDVKTWEQTVDERFTELATSLVNLREVAKEAVRKELRPGGLISRAVKGNV